MGFLMGAYGKLMAGQRMRSIQFQLTTVQSRLRRITKEIGLKEKMYEAQKRNMNNMLQAQTQAYILGGLSQMAASGNQMAAAYGAMMTTGQMVNSNDFKQEERLAFSTDYSALQQNAQMQASMAKNMWEQTYEMQKEADLQALRDVEESLQLEKDNLESQLKIAQADYEANKEMEKQGAQNLKPDYTGQS